VIGLSETVKLALEFPKSFIEELWDDETQATEAIKQAAVLDLFRQKTISLRKSAELLGLSYRDFQLLASQHKISLFDYEEGWGERELSTLKSLKAGSL
jgi:predicted HTH domain antitoxin